tara:strand:+ start:68 stop:565 length:498 start_codon:yes stop_codon:yes gene_type:complete
MSANSIPANNAHATAETPVTGTGTGTVTVTGTPPGISTGIPPSISTDYESYAPSTAPDLFEFNETMLLKDFMGKFDDGINTFNENIDIMRAKQKEFDESGYIIKEKINNNHKKNTYDRGSYLLTEKINFYDYWINMLYGTLKIMIVVLCIIVVIMLIYKIMNQSN